MAYKCVWKRWKARITKTDIAFLGNIVFFVGRKGVLCFLGNSTWGSVLECGDAFLICKCTFFSFTKSWKRKADWLAEREREKKKWGEQEHLYSRRVWFCSFSYTLYRNLMKTGQGKQNRGNYHYEERLSSLVFRSTVFLQGKKTQEKEKHRKDQIMRKRREGKS